MLLLYLLICHFIANLTLEYNNCVKSYIMFFTFIQIFIIYFMASLFQGVEDSTDCDVNQTLLKNQQHAIQDRETQCKLYETYVSTCSATTEIGLY